MELRKLRLMEFQSRLRNAVSEGGLDPLSSFYSPASYLAP